MSSLLKPKNRTKLYAIIVVVVVGLGAFLYFGQGMSATAESHFNLYSDSGESGDVAKMSAFIGAYDRSGNLVKDKTLQSGFMVEGVEIAYIDFIIKFTVVLHNIDWNAMPNQPEAFGLLLHPNGNDTIDTGSNLEYEFYSIDNYTELSPDMTLNFVAHYRIWDRDYVPVRPEPTNVTGSEPIATTLPGKEASAYNDIYFIQDAIGDPVKVLEDGTEVYLLQMSFYINLELVDLAGNHLTGHAVTMATWELSKDSGTGSIEIIIHDEAIAPTDINIDDVYTLPSDFDKTTIDNTLLDGDPEPDLLIIPNAYLT